MDPHVPEEATYATYYTATRGGADICVGTAPGSFTLQHDAMYEHGARDWYPANGTRLTLNLQFGKADAGTETCISFASLYTKEGRTDSKHGCVLLQSATTAWRRSAGRSSACRWPKSAS